MSSEPRIVQVEFSSEEDFRREYASNIANGGIFVRSGEWFELNEAVKVDLFLSYLGESMVLEGEVVHVVTAEMAASGAGQGFAVQFTASARTLRRNFETRLGIAPPSERDTGAGRRQGKRERAVLPVRIALEKQAQVVTRTRDVSDSGVLVAVGDTAIPVGQTLKLAMTNPETGEDVEVSGTVVRHLTDADGRVSAVGIQFDPQASNADMAAFLSDVKSSEHRRRLGGITGPLSVLGLETLVQMFGNASPRGGTLMVTSGTEEGYVAFEGGFLCGVQAGPLNGKAALARMLKWQNGTFEFQAYIEPHVVKTEPVPLSGAILDAMCDLDERARSAAGRGAQASDTDSDWNDTDSGWDDSSFDLAEEEADEGFRLNIDEGGPTDEQPLDIDLDSIDLDSVVEDAPASQADSDSKAEWDSEAGWDSEASWDSEAEGDAQGEYASDPDYDSDLGDIGLMSDTKLRASAAKVKRHKGNLSNLEEAILELAIVGATPEKLCAVIPEDADEIYSALHVLLGRGLVEIQE